MIQNFLDDQWILYACDNLDRATTPIADRDINIKHSLESLRPGHFRMLIHWWIHALSAVQVLLVGALATFRRRHIDLVFAVGSKNPIISRQIYSGFSHQYGQLGNKVQGFKYDVCCPISVGCLARIISRQ